MENWFLILVPFVLIVAFLVVIFLKTEEHYKKNTREMQRKIEDLKVRSNILEDKNNSPKVPSGEIQQVFHHFSELHKTIVKDYLK